jgi:hypothetical protein
MKRRSGEWIWPPADQWVTIWGMWLLLAFILAGGKAIQYLIALYGKPWMVCYYGAILLGAAGAALIGFAKLPLYRQRRFFTFGPHPVPERRRCFYRWGYRCAVVSAALLLLLSLR